MASSTILPNTYVALRLPSNTHKVVKIAPDTTIALGKYGTFDTNSLLGRPYYHTYEVLEKGDGRLKTELRIVPASELHAEVLAESLPGSATLDGDGIGQEPSTSYDVDVIGDNRLTIDDATRQALTMEEIEELKKADTGSGKEIIAKLMQSHAALGEKTTFALSKYTLRKRQKYLKRFTLLPLDVSMLTQWFLTEKEPARVMELREEILGLIASWSNAHYGELNEGLSHLQPSGRMLVVDDTAGLVVAALAERMGILYPRQADDEDEELRITAPLKDRELDNGSMPGDPDEMTEDNPTDNNQQDTSEHAARPVKKQRRHPPDAMSAVNNTITLLHPATQPNISMLSYFSYDPSDPSNKSNTTPATEHPLHTHLKSINFLQLTQPELDPAYEEPEFSPHEVVATWKSSQKSSYYRKRRRWERVKRVVDETRAGGFDGLVVATSMATASLMHHAVPLLKGGAQVVVYSPNVEPLAELADLYSSARRTAYLNLLADEEAPSIPCEDFPVDPRLLLAPTIQTARARAWQVLPGRTHPIMTSKGGAEGYLFTATRVIPAEGRVQARGNFAKKRKVNDENASNGSEAKVLKRDIDAAKEAEVQAPEQVGDGDMMET